MKRFLLNITKIIAFVFIIQIILIVVVLVIEKSYSFRVSDSINKVVIGHSMTECAIDDKIYKGSINVSQSGTGLNYSYVKLRKILNENPQIDTVILGIRPVDFTVSDRAEFSSSKINSKIAKYFFLFSKNEIKDYVCNINFYTSLLNVPFDFLINKMNVSNDIRSYGIGHYRTSFDSHVNTTEDFISYDIDVKDTINQFVIGYLYKIKILCDRNNVELICLTTPMYKSVGISKFNLFMDSLNIIYYDLSINENIEREEYKDAIHLNSKGAKIFSNNLDSLIINQRLK